MATAMMMMGMRSIHHHAAMTRVSVFALVMCVMLLVSLMHACVAAPVLPEGISAVKVDKLPFEDGFGTAEEVYTSGIADAVVGLRRAMHANPGVMYDEYFASETSLETLKLMGVDASDIMTGLGVTGLVAHIGAGTLESTMDVDSSVNTITLRADMDALPIHEETDVPFKSTVDGVMHACGHDAHTAMLLGAAMLLKRHESELVALNAAVRLFFQPAEEGGAGAKIMVDSGAIDGTSAAVMLHVGSSLDVGKFSAMKGRSAAACYTFHVVITGVGAHGASPHQSKVVQNNHRIDTPQLRLALGLDDLDRKALPFEFGIPSYISNPSPCPQTIGSTVSWLAGRFLAIPTLFPQSH